MRSIHLGKLVGIAFCLSVGAHAFGCGGSSENEASGTGRDTSSGNGGSGGQGVGGQGGSGQGGSGGQGGGCVPVQEACDGIDNNCDGVVDEGCDCVSGAMQPCYSGPPSSKGVGACKEGTQTCVDGKWNPDCVGEVLPNTDVCDGVDNDCNGADDDGDPDAGKACDTGKPGVCAAGTYNCLLGALVCKQQTSASPEVCDGLDNNCDGAADEGNPEGGVACMTGQLGVCAAGLTACVGGKTVCNQSVQPSADLCDGLDNNCDGAVDEGDPGGGVACMTGQLGVCADGLTACVGGKTVCNQSVQPSADICDGLDNNCDGAVDEGNPGGGLACSTGNPGACAAGTTKCSGGSIMCAQNNQPVAEVCGDGVDNDCDGVVDGAACACNTKVLLLGDSDASSNAAIASALTTAGMIVTTVNGGVSSYQNVPAANTFGAVVVLAGNEYDTDMPVAGQTGILGAWNGGTTGAVFTEWTAYKVSTGKWTTLAPLLLLDRSGLLAANGIETYTVLAAHPVWTGLPATFSTIDPNAPGAHNVGQVINGGTAIANLSSPSCNNCTAGVVVKSGASRTVQIAHSAAWNGGGAWVNDANLVKMMTNAAKWAAKCP